MPNYLFYVDEAGHAGVNYLDTAQPFHFAGGFLIPEGSVTQVAEQVESAKGGKQEIKGSSLAKAPRGQRKLAQTIGAIRATGSVPFFWAMERLFCISGKLVDVFLDTAYYAECGWLPLWDLEQREEIAQKLAEVVPIEVLNAFGRSYRKPDKAEWAEVLRSASTALAEANEPRLSSTFLSALGAVGHIVEQEDMKAEHSDRAALNMPALMHVLRLADRFVEFQKGRMRVVHDANVQFEDKFREMIQSRIVPPEQPRELILPGGRVHREFLGTVDSLDFADSRMTPGLQAADFLVSALGRCTKDIPMPPTQWPPEMHELATAVLPPMLDEESVFGGMYARMDTKARLALAMFAGPAESS